MFRQTVIGIACAASALFAVARPGLAKTYTLPELIELARKGNPGVQAGGVAAEAMESQVSEARRNWLPSGDITSFVTAVPHIQCIGPRADATDIMGNALPVPSYTNKQENCVSTNITPTHDFADYIRGLKGVWFRSDLKIVQPLYDFGKISAGVAAAEAGVAALRQKQAAAASDVELNVTKAYWGVKLARDLLDALDEGSGYIDTAQKKIEEQLAEGSGNATVTDRLRLRTVRAELDARILETKRLADFAQSGLRTLLGTEAPNDLEVDDGPFEPVAVPARPVIYYEQAALLNRPEVRALDYAVKAKVALSVLERRREYPDLALVATGTFSTAPTIESPDNAYLNNPFNSLSAGLAATLRIPLDLGPKLARASRMRAEAEETDLRRQEALGGIAFEVRKAHGELTEAAARVEAVHKGEKAGKAWVTAVSQNFSIGIAETRDFSDALTAFFAMRARYLQSVFDLNVAAASLARATGAPVP
ncbi:MAG TPA: TolC family protein [Polyangia bacterium]|jgi:outer membrane protein TolC